VLTIVCLGGGIPVLCLPFTSALALGCSAARTADRSAFRFTAPQQQSRSSASKDGRIQVITQSMVPVITQGYSEDFFGISRRRV